MICDIRYKVTKHCNVNYTSNWQLGNKIQDEKIFKRFVVLFPITSACPWVTDWWAVCIKLYNLIETELKIVYFVSRSKVTQSYCKPTANKVTRGRGWVRGTVGYPQGYPPQGWRSTWDNYPRIKSPRWVATIVRDSSSFSYPNKICPANIAVIWILFIR